LEPKNKVPVSGKGRWIQDGVKFNLDRVVGGSGGRGPGIKKGRNSQRLERRALGKNAEGTEDEETTDQEETSTKWGSRPARRLEDAKQSG